MLIRYSVYISLPSNVPKTLAVLDEIILQNLVQECFNEMYFQKVDIFKFDYEQNVKRSQNYILIKPILIRIISDSGNGCML
jgi:hypothetical protein